MKKRNPSGRVFIRKHEPDVLLKNIYKKKQKMEVLVNAMDMVFYTILSSRTFVRLVTQVNGSMFDISMGIS